MRIVQAMNALDHADAVTAHLLELDRVFRALGHETAIHSEGAHPDFAARRRPIAELPGADADVVLFHYAGFSRSLGHVARFRGRRGVVYHNVTPARFFREIPETYEFCRLGREQIADLPGVFHFGLADSAYNAKELTEAGLRDVRVLPIPWEISGLADAAPDPDVRREYGDGRTNVLMVGRMTPHKGAMHAVRAARAVRDRLGGEFRLILAGRTRGYGSFVGKLRDEIRREGLDRNVVLTGEVSAGGLRALYESAHALLVLSEHEGFCVPIVEAMALGVPVVAFEAAAVGETLGGAGVVLRSREPDEVAAAVASVTADAARRAEILDRQRERACAFTRDAQDVNVAAALDWIDGLDPPEEPAAELPSFSVVVCTYNRDWVLEKCLQALGRLDYPRYEVVVVNGPSTDDTSRVISRFPSVKRVDNPERNLSVSRNLGIAASAGDIVAFIDDDAVPNPDWLRVLADGYRDPTVGAVGGKVYGPGGEELQFDNGIVSRYGLPDAVRDEPGDCNDPHGEWFNILMGTNSSVRRSALERVGGFDENYEYFHDEADLFVRMIRAGYRVEHAPEAEVWHEFEKSRIRQTSRLVNWRVIVKNTIYFYFRVNHDWMRRPWDWVQPMRACLVHLGIFARWFVRGELGGGGFLRSLARWSAGVLLGYGKGWFRGPRCWLDRRKDARAATFRPFRTDVPRAEKPLHVALVSQQYPPDDCGGIGVYTEHLARGLVERGHRVTVVAQSPKDAVVWRDGVKVHRVRSARPPAGVPLHYRITRKNAARSLAVDRTVRRLVQREGVHLVEGPLWDAEVFATSLSRTVPLIVRLETPLALAAETQGWRRNADLELACAMEWATVRNADGVIDSSGTIVDMLARRFDVHLDGAPQREIPFGIPFPERVGAPRPGSTDARILFVGRLEARKGIDVLMRAVPRVLERCPGAQLDVAGEIPPGTRTADLLRGVDRALHDRITLHGRVDDAMRSTLYERCDVFVAPSRYESFGLVYLEAMSYGKPCVACDAGGAPRVVRDGETGVVVPVGDADRLAEALVELVQDPARRARLGEAGLRRVREHYSVEAMTERSLEFYETVLSAWHGEGQSASGPVVTLPLLQPLAGSGSR
jgi:glycosyltransferase involved in cell wall biosynthesis/GT2 family glycosyltransferase